MMKVVPQTSVIHALKYVPCLFQYFDMYMNYINKSIYFLFIYWSIWCVAFFFKHDKAKLHVFEKRSWRLNLQITSNLIFLFFSLISRTCNVTEIQIESIFLVPPFILGYSLSSSFRKVTILLDHDVYRPEYSNNS